MVEMDEVLEILKTQVAEKKFLDIGKKTADKLGVSKTKLVLAVDRLLGEGYTRYYLQVSQEGTNLRTHVKVLALPGTSYKEVHENLDKVQPIS